MLYMYIYYNNQFVIVNTVTVSDLDEERPCVISQGPLTIPHVEEEGRVFNQFE